MMANNNLKLIIKLYAGIWNGNNRNVLLYYLDFILILICRWDSFASEITDRLDDGRDKSGDYSNEFSRDSMVIRGNDLLVRIMEIDAT